MKTIKNKMYKLGLSFPERITVNALCLGNSKEKDVTPRCIFIYQNRYKSFVKKAKIMNSFLRVNGNNAIALPSQDDINNVDCWDPKRVFSVKIETIPCYIVNGSPINKEGRNLLTKLNEAKKEFN